MLRLLKVHLDCITLYFYLLIIQRCFVLLCIKMADTKDEAVVSSIHNDPNFSVVCSFLTRYGSLLGVVDISFEQLEKWIIDTRYGTYSVSGVARAKIQPRQTPTMGAR